MSLIETEFSARESNKPAKKKSEQPLASTYEAKTPRLDRNGSVKPTAGAGKAKESMGIFHFKKIDTATTACFREKKLYFCQWNMMARHIPQCLKPVLQTSRRVQICTLRSRCTFIVD